MYWRHWINSLKKHQKKAVIILKWFHWILQLILRIENKKQTPILHNLSQKRELEGTHHNLIYEDSIILTLNPDKGSIRKPGQSASQALSKILGTETQQRIKRLIYDQVTVTAGMQGRLNMWKIDWHKRPTNRKRRTHNDIDGCGKSVWQISMHP